VALTDAQRKARQKVYARRWYEKNRAKAIEQASAWWAANPEKAAASKRRWSERNPDKLREAARRWKREHPEEHRADYARWAAKYPEKAKANQRRQGTRYAMRKRDAFVEDIEPYEVLNRSRGICGICGLSVDAEDFHVDHVVPLARGGEHSYENVQAAHPRCNASKCHRLQEEMSHRVIGARRKGGHSL
jgi:5-methylcytosine-specific restriction endonuclease McrA